MKTSKDKNQFELRTSTFDIVQPLDGYIQLSPLGVFPHHRGLQNVDKTALEEIVKNFKSFFARLGRRFAGLPFYVGHPDVEGYDSASDRKAYGWIMDLEAREDGLYGRTKWSDAGRNLIGSGHYKFLSPTWNVAKIGEQNGRAVFRPTHLISVGLTNQPNLPVQPLANSEDAHETETLVGVALPLSPAASEGAQSGFPDNNGSLESTSHSAPPGPPAPVANSAPGANSRSDSARCNILPDAASHLDRRISDLTASLANCQQQLAVLEEQLITNVLDNAVAQARILPVERKLWHNELRENFSAASASLANAKPQLNLALKTNDLPRVNPEQPGSEKTRKEIQALVNEKMHREGLTYHQAWIELKEDRPELFEALAAPAAEPFRTR
jgi:hypothetical protein